MIRLYHTRTLALRTEALLEAVVEVYEEPSQAKTKYGQPTYDSHLGAGDPDESRELGIGVRNQLVIH